MHNAKEKSKEAFNRQAATYDHDRSGQHARALYPEILERLTDVRLASILDVGCGTGALLEQVLERFKGIQAAGLDIAENMIDRARKRLMGRATLVLGDAEHMPFTDGAFDVVCCNDSFHHYPSPENALQEIKRVLKPDGMFILGDCWQPMLSRGVMNMAFKVGHTGDVHMYTEPEIRTLLARYFMDVTWEKVNNSSYVATARKQG